MSSHHENRFDQVAHEWDEKPERVEAALKYAKAMAECLEGQSPQTLLEVGCGSGNVSLFLEESFGFQKMVGVDTSVKMLEVFAQKAKRLDLPLTTLCSDLQVESLEGEYDLCCSCMSLHHMKHPEIVLEKMIQALRDQGWIFVVDFDEQEENFHNHADVHHHGFDRKAMREILIQHGIEVRCESTVNAIQKADREFPIFMMGGVRV